MVPHNAVWWRRSMAYRFFGEMGMIATTIFHSMRSDLSFSRRSRSGAGFVPFWSLETAGFGDPEKL
jgi:hypothetical protein